MPPKPTPTTQTGSGPSKKGAGGKNKGGEQPKKGAQVASKSTATMTETGASVLAPFVVKAPGKAPLDAWVTSVSSVFTVEEASIHHLSVLTHLM
jgi:hypothetical protein